MKHESISKNYEEENMLKLQLLSWVGIINFSACSVSNQIMLCNYLRFALLEMVLLISSDD